MSASGIRMARGPRRFLVLASTAFLLLASQVNSVAGAAISTCSGSPSSKFDGFWNTGAYYEGVSAVLTVRYGAVCDTDHSQGNVSAAWTMIGNNAYIGGGYAQSGYLRWYGSSIYHFAQQRQDPAHGYQTVIGSAISPGEAHRYWQQWDPACSCVHSNVDTTRFINSSFNPFSAWTAPFSEQYFGETTYLASDMPGSSASTAKFAQISVQNLDNTWRLIPDPFLSSRNDQTSRWATSALDSTTTQIWTK